MISLTNEQRACLGLSPVDPAWRLVKLIPSPYDTYYTYAYIDDATHTVRKYIRDSEDVNPAFEFEETAVCETLSDDGLFILPKTEKGKPVKLTAANLIKKTPVGTYLSCVRGHIVIGNYTTQQNYYTTDYEKVPVTDSTSFLRWINAWCTETTAADLSDIAAFGARERVHVNYKEGDFFRFKLNRRLWGYGRLLLNYAALRKTKEPFWDVYMGKPLIVGIYHVATENPHLTPDDLRDLPMLPPEPVMDNRLYYGDAVIIGNEPIIDSEIDYPINYGPSFDARDKRALYQCGRIHRTLPDRTHTLCNSKQGDYRHGAVGFSFEAELPVLLACIRSHANQPYWDLGHPYRTNADLRNPKNHGMLLRIRAEMGLDADGNPLTTRIRQ